MEPGPLLCFPTPMASTPVQKLAEVGPLPRGTRGRSGSLHCAGVRDKELPAEAGRGIGVGLCARQSAVGRPMTSQQAGARRSNMTLNRDTRPVTCSQPTWGSQKLGLKICA